MWFDQLMGFAETDRDTVLRSIAQEGQWLRSRVNGRRYRCGRLEMPSLAELRAATAAEPPASGPRSLLREVVGDVQQLHLEHPGALFQVASQFNLLEMLSPAVTPDAGVSIYAHDPTQGPACAIACGAGTIYRNYFVPLEGGRGQTAERQIDGLAELGAALGNDGERLWRMRNGYALCTAEGLREIGARIAAASEAERDALRGLLRVGWQREVEVTLPGGGHTVSQVYGSALPVAYGRPPASAWEPFARLVLEASYEATLRAAALEARASGRRKVFLTQLGGGAFGNAPGWILDAIARAMRAVEGEGLDVALVSYGRSKPELRPLVAGWAEGETAP